ncbi:hypothetical protein TNIN_59621 [Trichonephila inaurata madagascariensis]|uniref:Uncharacterized protein n=1 Tax=Trichonephila inaurata madagascariensis TaxID=2747483 RepID=A0A8X6MMF4_9ARAC|nr:hypothetical protein TNIN_59621 [Trichonephila inaurata madagascariensis]
MKGYVQNNDQEIHIPQEITQQEEKLQMCSEKADSKLTENHEDAELKTPTDGQMKSDISTDENGIVPNTDFQVEEKKLTDTFNSISSSLSNTSNIEMESNSSPVSMANNSNSEIGYYNEAFSFTDNPTNASLDNGTQENVNDTVVYSLRKKNIFFKK